MPATKKTRKKPAKKAAAKKPAARKKAAKKRTKRGSAKAAAAKLSPGRRGRGPQPGAGKPPFKPTDDDRKRVELLAALIPQDEIAGLVFNPRTNQPIDEKTLRRHFRYELDHGKSRVDAKVGQSLVQRALDISHPQGFQAAKFYLGTRAGWTETSRLEVDGKAGVLVAPSGVVSVEDWIEKARERTDDAPEPGLE